MKLSVFKNDRDIKIARGVQRSLFDTARYVKREWGDGLRGYSLIAWDKEGGIITAIKVEPSFISRQLVPTLTADALNRHLAEDNTLDTLLKPKGK